MTSGLIQVAVLHAGKVRLKKVNLVRENLVVQFSPLMYEPAEYPKPELDQRRINVSLNTVQPAI
jgi:hypothetical protein